MTPPHTNSAALILAAGKGTRMHAEFPKVLQPLLGMPMLSYVHNALTPLYTNNVWSLIGFQKDKIYAHYADVSHNFLEQTEQLGTGHALQTAWETLKIKNIQYLLVINGDTPLIETQHIEKFITECQKNTTDLAFISLTLENAGSFGRVIRNNNGILQAIIEAKDFNSAIHGKETNEVNAGIYYFNMATVAPLLSKLTNSNNNNEYYITDLIDLAIKAQLKIIAVNYGNCTELLGINNPQELIFSETALRKNIVNKHIANGVFIHSPEMVHIGAKVTIKPGTHIYGPCHILGSTEIADNVIIHPYSYIQESIIHSHAVIHAFSHLEKAVVGTKAQAGPYARLRPKAILQENVKVGNFVEVKNTTLEKGAKASHLTYLGDATVGEDANIGAGTITCNYDGKNKHHTTIGKNAFIGSNSALVAPVEIGENALIGAGSVITKNVPENSLAIARGVQRIFPKLK